MNKGQRTREWRRVQDWIFYFCRIWGGGALVGVLIIPLIFDEYSRSDLLLWAKIHVVVFGIGILGWIRSRKKERKEKVIESRYCTCYSNGNKPALLTDWRRTNICQSCGKPKKEE